MPLATFLAPRETGRHRARGCGGGPEEPARYSSLAEAGEVAPASFGYRRRSSPPELPPNPATRLMTVANTTAPSTYANNPWPSAVTRIKTPYVSVDARPI